MCSIVWLEVDARLAEVVTAPEELIEAEDLASRRKPLLWDHLLAPTKEEHGARCKPSGLRQEGIPQPRCQWLMTLITH